MPSLSVVSKSARCAPYPRETTPKGWKFNIDYERLERSDTWALASADMRPWLLMLWLTAWRQAPCGSLPNDDELIAARLGMPTRLFVASRDILMRGWWLADDGRMYHETITEQVLDMIERRHGDADRKKAWRDKKNQQLTSNVPRDGRVSPRLATTPEPEPEPEEVLKDIEAAPLVAEADASAPYRCPPCPNQEVVDLYHESLPSLPSVVVLNDSRKRAVAARWREVCASEKLDKHGGIDFFRWFFGHVGGSDFLMGRAKSGRQWSANFDWLMTPTKFARVVEGAYHGSR